MVSSWDDDGFFWRWLWHGWVSLVDVNKLCFKMCCIKTYVILLCEIMLTCIKYIKTVLYFNLIVDGSID